MTVTPTAPVNSRTPSESWTLDKLGKFLADTARKTAENIWNMGHALNIAHAKCEVGGWEEFCAQHVSFMSKTTIWRLRRVADLPFEEVQGAKLKQVYKRIGSGKPKATTESRYSAAVEEPPADADVIGQDTTDTGPKDAPDAPDVEAIVSKIVGDAPDYIAALEDAVLELADDVGFIVPDRATILRVLIEAMTRLTA